jgi:hypothetical protein
MDDFDKDQVLQWYGWLEDELLEILKYIPPADPNLETFSPRLASLIIESCGLLDSILRQISPDPATVDGKSKPRKDLDIVDYAKQYAVKFEIAAAKSIVLISPPRYLIPFSPWLGLLLGGEYQSPSWWRIHNDLKHDRIANLRKAQLEVAIQSLCGLHLMIATVPEFASAVLRRGWVPGSALAPRFRLEILEGTMPGTTLSLLVESKLFIVARGFAKFPDRIEDFYPGQFDFGASERIINFFWRSY